MLMVVIFAVIFAAGCAYLAQRRGRSPLAWGALGLIFQLLALVVLALLPHKLPAAVVRE